LPERAQADIAPAMDEEAALKAAILRGPDPQRDGTCSWTRAGLVRWMEAHLGKSCYPACLSHILCRMGLSRQKARASHPQRDPRAGEHVRKKGSTTR